VRNDVKCVLDKCGVPHAGSAQISPIYLQSTSNRGSTLGHRSGVVVAGMGLWASLRDAQETTVMRKVLADS